MTMYLFDTDTLTHLHAGNIHISNKLKTLQDDEISITVITKIEILRGRMEYLLKAFSGNDLLKAPANALPTNIVLRKANSLNRRYF